MKSIVHELLAGVRECHELDLASVMLEVRLTFTERKKRTATRRATVGKIADGELGGLQST